MLPVVCSRGSRVRAAGQRVPRAQPLRSRVGAMEERQPRMDHHLPSLGPRTGSRSGSAWGHGARDRPRARAPMRPDLPVSARTCSPARRSGSAAAVRRPARRRDAKLLPTPSKQTHTASVQTKRVERANSNINIRSSKKYTEYSDNLEIIEIY